MNIGIQNMKNKTTHFRSLIAKGCTLLQELRGLESQRKLSCEGFLSEALRNADCDQDRLDEIEHILENAKARDEAEAFIGRLTKAFGQQQYTRPFLKVEKCLRVFTREERNIQAQLNEMNIKVLEAIAVASQRAIKRAPKEFGTIEDMDAHILRLEELQTKLQATFTALEKAVTADDVEMSREGLYQSELERGLTRVTFKKKKFVNVLFVPGWPERIVVAELNFRHEKITKRGVLVAQKAMEVVA